MARVIITALHNTTSLGLIGDGEVEFIGTDRKGKIVGVKKLRGVLRDGTHSIDVGGKTCTNITASLSSGTTCEWKMA
jgi:hypothetical protein